MKITKNFELAEFIKSPTAEKLKIDNTPRNEYINNIRLGRSSNLFRKNEISNE